MVFSSPKHNILGTRVYSPLTLVLLVLLNLVCVLLSVDDLQITGFDRLKIVLFGSEFLKSQEARRKEHFIQLSISHCQTFKVITPNNKVKFSKKLQ